MGKVERNIELRQLEGQTAAGRLVRQAVDEIYLNGIRIGFVGHRPTDPLNFIRRGVLGDRETLAAIQAAVEGKLGGRGRAVNGIEELVSVEEPLDATDERADG